MVIIDTDYMYNFYSVKEQRPPGGKHLPRPLANGLQIGLCLLSKNSGGNENRAVEAKVTGDDEWEERLGTESEKICPFTAGLLTTFRSKWQQERNQIERKK